MRNPTRRKQQSAMEYLMTYGWSILIIAIVLAALYSLGVFGNGLSGPRVPPNSCRIYRPNGAGTTVNINLEGTCNGELPEYVMQISGGTTSFVKAPTVLPAGSSATITLWVNFAAMTSTEGAISSANTIVGGSAQSAYGTLSITEDGTGCDVQVGTASTLGWTSADTASCPQLNKWYFLTAYVNQSANTYGLYVNGVLNFSHSFSGTTNPTAYFQLGHDFYETGSLDGMEADVQIYNTVLEANTIRALYQEGLGGAPISLQNLVAWYPLNGDANDYSGDYYNGAQNSISFTSAWTSGYAIP